MSMLRMLTMIAALTAGSATFADTPAKAPAKAPAEKKADPKADKPADKPASTDKAAKKETIADADAQRFYGFVEKLVAIAVDTRDDCAKMAAGFNAHIDANKALLKEAADMKQQGKEVAPAMKGKMEKKFREDLGPLVMHKCGKDKPVMDALMRLKPPSAN